MLVPSSDVRFTRAANFDDQAVMVVASDEDGWLQIQVEVAKLRTNVTTCASNSFDRIIMADVSGMGFRLQLDDVKLQISSEGDMPVTASEGWSFPSPLTTNLLPVFNTDLTQVCLQAAAVGGT
jgi:hypothetical protein